jgi:hypothetical protein
MIKLASAKAWPRFRSARGPPLLDVEPLEGVDLCARLGGERDQRSAVTSKPSAVPPARSPATRPTPAGGPGSGAAGRSAQRRSGSRCEPGSRASRLEPASPEDVSTMLGQQAPADPGFSAMSVGARSCPPTQREREEISVICGGQPGAPHRLFARSAAQRTQGKPRPAAGKSTPFPLSTGLGHPRWLWGSASHRASTRRIVSEALRLGCIQVRPWPGPWPIAGAAPSPRSTGPPHSLLAAGICSP